MTLFQPINTSQGIVFDGDGDGDEGSNNTGYNGTSQRLSSGERKALHGLNQTMSLARVLHVSVPLQQMDGGRFLVSLALGARNRAVTQSATNLLIQIIDKVPLNAPCGEPLKRRAVLLAWVRIKNQESSLCNA